MESVSNRESRFTGGLPGLVGSNLLQTFLTSCLSIQHTERK